MKIEAHIRERDVRGNFLGRRNAFLESCRVYKEAGDSIRMDNMAVATQQFFELVAKFYVRAWREAKTTDEFLSAISPIIALIKSKDKKENRNDTRTTGFAQEGA